jgi:hypothetical protein
MPKKIRAPSILGEAERLISAARALLRPIQQVDKKALLSPGMPDGLRVLLANNLLADTYLFHAHARLLSWLHKQSKGSRNAWAQRRGANDEAALSKAVMGIKAAHPGAGRRAIASHLRAAEERWAYVTDEDVRRILAHGDTDRAGQGWMTSAELERLAAAVAEVPEIHRHIARLIETGAGKAPIILFRKSPTQVEHLVAAMRRKRKAGN